jgi:hypothetical protein
VNEAAQEAAERTVEAAALAGDVLAPFSRGDLEQAIDTSDLFHWLASAPKPKRVGGS